jgi:cytochrome P450
MNQEKLFEEILKPVNTPNPYPLYSQLRATAPVSKQEDGTYVVSTYREIVSLLHDPRVSSDERKSTRGRVSSGGWEPPFLFLDPPNHDRLRRLVMQKFTPERVERMHDSVTRLANKLLDAKRNHSQLDIVDDFAHPVPVNVFSEMLGVPSEDRPRIAAWVPALVRRLEPDSALSEAEIERASQALAEMGKYMSGLMAERRARPADDLISDLDAATMMMATTASADSAAAEKMSEQELLSVVMLLLGAGYETTVNLITNSMLTLLRHPHTLERLRRDPNSIIRTIEEVLRFDPPVQFRTRTTLADINIAGVTIPKGASVALLFASGSRDSSRFVEPDRFDPDRTDNQHLGFGGGIHYCVGAPLARLETLVALKTLVRRLVAPRLVNDPPPYRHNASLRGPQHLIIAFDRIDD